jgi:hypothetical protein
VQGDGIEVGEALSRTFRNFRKRYPIPGTKQPQSEHAGSAAGWSGHRRRLPETRGADDLGSLGYVNTLGRPVGMTCFSMRRDDIK